MIIISALAPILAVQAGNPNDSQAQADTDQIEQVRDNVRQMLEKISRKENNKEESSSENKASLDISAKREIKQIDQIKNQQLIEKKKKSVPTPDAKEIERQAEFASQVTGVRKDFLMGMLVVESNLGKNTGKCTYGEVKEGAESAHARGALSKRAWQTFQERKKIISDIADSLGYDYEELKVSCNPPYAGTGGAMGIPQFMPDTWMEYKDKVAAIVGTDNPDPWSARDGVLAMALKVADVPGVVEHNVWSERNASKMYLSGSTSSRYEWYASQIQYWARNYEELVG